MPLYTVTWTSDATEALAEAWYRSSDRESVTIAAAAIDDILRHDPIGGSVELKEGLRRLEVNPLLVAFTVREDDRICEVEFLGLAQVD